jgi:hypothetical protein
MVANGVLLVLVAGELPDRLELLVVQEVGLAGDPPGDGRTAPPAQGIYRAGAR